jgi:hypothetical protein
MTRTSEDSHTIKEADRTSDGREGGLAEATGGIADLSVQPTSKSLQSIRNLAGMLPELIAMADALPAEYRQHAFAEFIQFALTADHDIRLRGSGDPAQDVRRTADGISQPQVRVEKTEEAFPSSALVEDSLAIPRGSLMRVLQIDADKGVKVLSRVEGKSISERQIKLAQIVCYVREKGLGEMKTDIEMLRAACIAQGNYDPANFAANFRRDGSILETETPGSKERLFTLSRKGVESAAALLRQLAGI